MSNIYVDFNKSQRADRIVKLLTGTEPRDGEEASLKATHERLANVGGKEVKDYKGEDLKNFVYIKLGGLVRTDVEHKEALKKEEETKKSFDEKEKNKSKKKGK